MDSDNEIIFFRMMEEDANLAANDEENQMVLNFILETGAGSHSKTWGVEARPASQQEPSKDNGSWACCYTVTIF